VALSALILKVERNDKMQWINLTDSEQLLAIKKAEGYHIIFKHSTRCSISMMAKKNVELEWDIIPSSTPMYFLDLINYRAISNEIAEIFHVHHESPQILLIKDGECILDASHSDISIQEIVDLIK
jgi:bacillithiol system protein YtxJ